MTKRGLLYRDESYAIRGAMFEVYKEMGCGLPEGIYQECLEIEFAERGIPFRCEVDLPVFYKGCELKKRFRPDFICYEKIIVELKSVVELKDVMRAQVHTYLRHARLDLGILANFGHYPGVDIERFAYGDSPRYEHTASAQDTSDE